MTILVTGYQGFIAGRLLKNLEEDVVKLEYGDYPIDTDEIKGVTAVVHVGAIPVMNPKISPFKFFHLNVAKTVELLEASRKVGVKKFIFISSCVVSYPLLNTYDYTKAQAEQWCQIYKKYIDEVIIFRLHNVYGEKNTKGPIENFANALITGQPIKVTGDGSQERDFVYVGDVVKAITTALYSYDWKKYQGIHEIGTGVATSIKDLLQMMVTEYQKFGKESRSKIDFIPAPYTGLQSVKCPLPLFLESPTPLDVGVSRVFHDKIHKVNAD